MKGDAQDVLGIVLLWIVMFSLFIIIAFSLGFFDKESNEVEDITTQREAAEYCLDETETDELYEVCFEEVKP